MKPGKVVVASNNRGKLREIAALLDGLDLCAIAQAELGIGEAEESGLSFVENAIIKARHAAACSGLAAIADDSGLEVGVLGGRPGIHSARYAGAGASDRENLQLLLENIRGIGATRPPARFECVMVYMRNADDPTPVIAEGSWAGYIVDEPVGESGFGYDPVFFVPEQGCTAAQLAPELKNIISHRAQALHLLLKKLQALPGPETGKPVAEK